MASTAPSRPTSTLTISSAARAALRKRERPVFGYYNDLGGNRGHCTWGIGILAHRGPCTADELNRKVDPGQVEASFIVKLNEAEQTVRRRVTRTITQEQFDALVSFTYNVGSGNAGSTFRLVNQGKFPDAAKKMSGFVYVIETRNGKKTKRKIRGLVERRLEESAAFRSEK